MKTHARCLAAWVVCALALAPLRSFAAEPIPPGPWQYTTVATLNFTQSAFTANWYGGDTGSLLWVVGADSKAERQFTEHFNLTNSLALAYGQSSNQARDPVDPSRLTWEAPEKSTDRIDFESAGRGTFGWFADPYAAVGLTSQFEDAASDPFGTRTIGFNPVRLDESVGLARVLQKTEDREAIARVGFGLRQTYAKSYVSAITDDKVKVYANDGGVEFQANATQPMMGKSVLYKGELKLYKAVFYSDEDELAATLPVAKDYWQAVDVNFQNAFTGSINKWLGVTLTAQLIYDKFDAAANTSDLADVVKKIRKAGQFRRR
jgi:hypothetical protein